MEKKNQTKRKKEEIKASKNSAEYKLRRKALLCCVSIFASVCLMAGGVWAAKEWFDVDVENPIFYVNDVIDDDGDIIRIVEGVVQVGSYEELNAIAKKVNAGEYIGDSQQLYKTAVYSVDKHIDCEGKSLTPIGNEENNFSGVFNGNGYSISNFKIEADSNNVGLFGTTSNAGIYNVSISGDNVVSGKENVGIILGAAVDETFVFGCSTSGKVSGKTNVGGVVGSCSSSSIIEACANFAKVSTSTNYAKVGGIVAVAEGVVVSCTNSGNIEYNANGVEAGGIVSSNKALVLKCRNNTPISGSGQYCVLGGISAKAEGQIKFCFNLGCIESKTISTVGGVAGINKNTIYGSYNNGQLSSCEVLGGVVGDNFGVVSNCFNASDIFEYGNFAGGIAGRSLTASAKIENSYNGGAVIFVDDVVSPVEKGQYFGGIAGWNEGEISKVYNRAEVSALQNVDGVTGYSSATGSFANVYLLSTAPVNSSLGNNFGVSVYAMQNKTLDEMTGINALQNLTDFSSDIWKATANADNEYFVSLACFANAENFDEDDFGRVYHDVMKSIEFID